MYRCMSTRNWPVRLQRCWEAEFGTPMGKHFYPELVEHSQTPNGLPLTMVAVEDGRLQGTVGVWRTDMLSRQDLTPWLACLVVRPELRSRGIGRALQEAVKEYCRGPGLSCGVSLYDAGGILRAVRVAVSWKRVRNGRQRAAHLFLPAAGAGRKDCGKGGRLNGLLSAQA